MQVLHSNSNHQNSGLSIKTDGGIILQENKFSLYFSMLLGAIGTVVILLFSTMYMVKEQNSFGYIGTFGFLLVIIYINFLEERAGISTKLIWIKSIVSMILFISFLYFLYL